MQHGTITLSDFESWPCLPPLLLYTGLYHLAMDRESCNAICRWDFRQLFEM